MISHHTQTQLKHEAEPQTRMFLALIHMTLKASHEGSIVLAKSKQTTNPKLGHKQNKISACIGEHNANKKKRELCIF